MKTDWLIFLILSLPLIYLSRKYILKPRTYGFYRMISWMCIIGLFTMNYESWFRDPWSIGQLCSWILLSISLGLIVPAVIQMQQAGAVGGHREEKEIYRFEATASLIRSGVFKHIRHPMYASLLYLTSRIFLKDPTWFKIVVAGLSSISLFITALLEERMCLEYFGNAYRDYMSHTKRFVPFVW